MKFPAIGAIAMAAVLLSSGGCSAIKSKSGDRFGAGLTGPQIGKYRDGAGGAYAAGERGQPGTPNVALGPMAERVIYFLYDSSEVPPQFVPLINSHADYLAANPNKTAVLEGHADERGSPEYNIALGEQRAKAVAKLMKLQGVVDGQIQIVSFGEEKPEAPGHDDNAWQKNRRVEISYPGP